MKKTMIKKKISKLTALVLAVVTLLGALTSCELVETVKGWLGFGEDAPMADPVDDNYRTFYQVFVGSFSDGNNDGIGDLRGVINRMDYLNDGNLNSKTSLGVQGLWLSPIFSSPSYHKYDVKDYYQVDWRFGTEEDLVELVNLAHERNVKVILDLVLNHTSNQHPWYLEFKEARLNGDTSNKYYDYYTCVSEAEKKNGSTYMRVLGGDFWVECNFSSDMPELNYDNPEVKQEMLEVAKYYLDLGIDGFRFDAVKYIYYGDTERSVNFWNWYMGELRAYDPDIYAIGECWSGEAEILRYIPAMNCFNFAVSGAGSNIATAAKGRAIYSYTSYVESYQDKIQAKNPAGMPSFFLSNHDQDRIAGAFIVDNYMKMAANLYMLAPGTPVIYYGEEIGMRGSRASENTDANRRLAMLWGDGDLVKDPVGATYKNQISSNVSLQNEDENSILNHYRELLTVRHTYPAIARGEYDAISFTGASSLGGFIVEYQGEYIFIVHNVSSEEVEYDLANCTALAPHTISAIADFIGCGAAKLNGTVLTIGAQTSVILK